MTHGRKAKSNINPRVKNGGSHLTGFSTEPEKSLESRVARLEARIDEMQEELDRVSGTVPAHIAKVIEGMGKKHPGPNKRMDDTELFLNRDDLVQWLEKHWPSIVKALLAAKNPRAIAAVFRPIAAPREIRAEWQKRIVGHPAKLHEFLNSEKFRVRPPKKTIDDALEPYTSAKRQRGANRLPTRQIANAMAGVPKLRWRTSFDKCTKTPSALRVGYETAEHYRLIYRITERQT